jgi:hypothetical protein
VQAQRCSAWPANVAGRQNLSRFKPDLSLVLLDGQPSLCIVIQPQRARRTSGEGFGVFYSSLPTENAAQPPKLRPLTTVNALALVPSFLNTFPLCFRHCGKVFAAERTVVVGVRPTSKVSAPTCCRLLILASRRFHL